MNEPDAYYYASAVAIPLGILACALAYVLYKWANHRWGRT